MQKVNERLATVIRIRKNAIRAIEYLVTSSSDLETLQASNDYLDAAASWIRETHGSENVVFATKHFDETTIHLSAMVVPIDPKRKLNASYFVDGRAKLSQLQSDFFRKVGEPFGLQRGIEGSTARHTSIAEYYSIVNQTTPQPTTEIPVVPDPTPDELRAEARGFETAHSRAVAAAAAAKKKRDAEIMALLEAQSAKLREATLSIRQMEQEKKGLSEWHGKRVLASDLALEKVLEKLGCVRDTADKKTMNWRTPIGRISLDGMKFYAHDMAVTGVGAIKLTELLEDIDEEGSLRLLSVEFGSKEVMAEAVARAHDELKSKIEAATAKPEPAFQLPVPSPTNWPRVMAYMLSNWKLSAPLVQASHDAGKLYADKYANVVFVLRGKAGVELHGTGERPFHGFRGEKASFELSNSDEKKVAFVDTSVDALSLVALDFKGRVISLNQGSARVAKSVACQFEEAGCQIVAAFSNDRSGDSLAHELGPRCARLRPTLKNWHKDLLAGKQAPFEMSPDEEYQEPVNPEDQRLRER